MKFVRRGNLVPQQHDQDDEERTYHTAPVEYGIYAFPIGYVEYFLLGGIGAGNVRNGRYSFLKDKNKKKLMVRLDEFYGTSIDEYSKKPEMDRSIILPPYDALVRSYGLTWKDVYPYVEDEDGIIDKYIDNECYSDGKLYPIAFKNKPKYFEYNGNIWHHLTDEGGSRGNLKYVKTEEILKRSGCWVLTDMKTYERALKKKVKVIKRTAFAESHMSGCSSGYPLHYFDKDWAEVFIEKVE
jgi:hypothetical protein